MVRLIQYFIRFKVVRFIISGGSAACVTIGTVFILTELLEVWYLAASALGFVCAVMVNFLLQKFWTFRESSFTHAHRQTISFFTVNVVNFFINGSLMFIFVEYFHVLPVVAQVCSAAVIAMESFIMYTLIFRVTHSALPVCNDHIIESELERVGENA